MSAPQVPAEVVRGFALELIASFDPADRLQLLEDAVEQLLEETSLQEGVSAQLEAEAQQLRQELSDALQST